VFYIGYVAHPRLDADGRRRVAGAITVGPDSPSFQSDLTYWSPSDYLEQWKEGIARLAAGEPRSELVTSYAGPDAASHERVSMRREGTTVVLERASNDGKGSVSEWRLPLGQLLAFLADE
jgi:hypothetical protein